MCIYIYIYIYVYIYIFLEFMDLTKYISTMMGMFIHMNGIHGFTPATHSFNKDDWDNNNREKWCI